MAPSPRLVIQTPTTPQRSSLIIVIRSVRPAALPCGSQPLIIKFCKGLTQRRDLKYPGPEHPRLRSINFGSTRL